jgi:hypothetical protein
MYDASIFFKAYLFVLWVEWNVTYSPPRAIVFFDNVFFIYGGSEHARVLPHFSRRYDILKTNTKTWPRHDVEYRILSNYISYITKPMHVYFIYTVRKKEKLNYLYRITMVRLLRVSIVRLLLLIGKRMWNTI